MQPNPGPGKLIVMEGLDGSGTSTQAPRLAQWLRHRGIRVHVTREPTPGAAGVLIRPFLAKRFTLDGKTLAALFSADRLDHLYAPGGIADRLRRGEWVIMDRYYLSSFAYQALSLDDDELQWIEHLHAACLIPDVTYFLDAPVRVCLDRIAAGRAFHFEIFEREDILKQVRRNYLDTIIRLKQMGQPIQMIDGTLPIQDVLTDLRKRTRLLFDSNHLTLAELNELWARWPALREILDQAEATLGLSLLVVTPICGGHQLTLAGKKGIYHLQTTISAAGTLSIRDASRLDHVQEQLRRICSDSGEIWLDSQLRLPGM